MGNNNLQKKYSLRKFKGIGLASAVIGLFFANQSVYANVTANGKDETTIVKEFDKVSSSAKTTFTDDQNPTKKVTVDAVADIRYKQPTKANYNTGDVDGTDSIKYHSEATVNYLLESDKSKLQDSKVVEGERATVTTPYDKKGIAYDTDGKDYRESSVEKTGEAVTENSGKEEKIKANDKEYTLVRSEVVGKDKATYEKTKFNDIEAPVSPEKMHNNLGEINYEKITGKVYLVEETSDGKYGKFVEASNIKSDAEAVEAWKNGQATAKNFTKENVTLQKGDTILVLDRDTYAHGSGKRTVNTINYRREKVTAAPEYNRVVSSEEIRDVNAYPSYALSDGSVSGKYLTAHKDAVDEHYSDWAKDYPEVETREDSIYVNKGVVTISDDLSKIKVVNADSTTNETEFTKKEVTTKVETDYVVEELITPVRAYKVMDEGSPVVNHYYRMHITRESKAYGMVGLAVVRIKYLTTEDREIKPEVIRVLGDGYELNVYNQYSGNTKVGERRDEKIYERFYDATSEKYETLKDERTGLTYEYVGLKQASSAASGKVVGAGMTEVIYEYRLVSEEEKTPSSSVVTKTGSVDVKHVVINEDGMLKTLKETEVVKNNVPLEYEDTYVTYSKGVKVSERKKKRTVKEKYYTTDKQYSTLKDEATGLVYKYVGLTSDSAPAAGDVTEGEKHVIYSYTLDKQEETTPSKTVEAKGTVVVKYVDANGNEIKNAENVVTDAVVKTTKTYATKSGDVELSTRDEVTENNVNYNAAEKKVDTITKDGKKYKFYRVLPVDTKFNNVTEETGKVKEGTTTVVYQYDEIIPVNPNKPNDNTPNTPKPGDKVPNDPQNRTFEQLGVLKEVKRNITYVYENGPKAGQEASTPVNQKARFTRTAEINSRTGEVVYTSEWTPGQKLVEVVSPEITKYAVDKEKVAELPVTHESADSSEIVKYRENPDVIEHNAAKDKKGSVVVKYVDAQGNEIDTAVTVKDNVVVEKATTKVYADREETTYTATNEEYNTVANRKNVIEANEKKYNFYRVLPVDAKFNNVVEENGKVKEGTTTVVYQYDEIIPVNPNKPNDNIPNDPNPENGTPNKPKTPNDNTPNDPKPGDKVPNDPQNRTYEQLGVLKEVKRNITYVYENGPKAGQEAAAPVNQKARFTRTAEINSRTGEVVYTSEWTKAQKLAEVVSPEIAKYAVDRAKIDELSVTHESTDSNEVVKYRENPDIIEHDAAKDKKGTVIVKFVDEQGNEIAKSITVKGNVLVAKATTKVYADRDDETEYTATNEEYNTELTRQDTIEFNGKKYIYQRVLPVSATLGNSDKETGKVPEGTTTVIYQYAEEVDSFISAFPPKEEVPEFNGKVDDAEKDKKGTVIVKYVDIKENFLASDVVVKDNVVVAKARTTITGDKSETTYTATGEEYAVVPPQTIEVDGVTFKLKSVLPASNKFNNTIEEKGLVKEGVTTVVYQYVMQIEAPEVEVPEFEGGVIPLDPPTVDKPEFEGGVVPLDPPKVEIPKLEIPNPNPQPEPNPNPQPKPEEPKKEEPKKEEPKQNDSTPGNMNKVNETPSSVQENTLKELPNTGTGQEFAIFGAAASAILSGLGLLVPTKKEK